MLGLLTGGVGAIAVNLIKGVGSYMVDRSDKKHELALLDRQGIIQQNMAIAKAQGDAYVADANAYASEIESKEKTIRASMKSDIWIIAFLNGSVRPAGFYLYTAFFFYLLWVATVFAENKDLPLGEFVALPVITTFLSLLEMITSFWFINREFAKRWK
jgi:hypothetical protein